mmetsp:Transcript_17759/g.24710  ORF Transcript_17759/g.24710 Transcript_17759/m.24710 type:complete len:319 (-) Transcript_17759:1315-2271(-)
MNSLLSFFSGSGNGVELGSDILDGNTRKVCYTCFLHGVGLSNQGSVIVGAGLELSFKLVESSNKLFSILNASCCDWVTQKVFCRFHESIKLSCFLGEFNDQVLNLLFLSQLAFLLFDSLSKLLLFCGSSNEVLDIDILLVVSAVDGWQGVDGVRVVVDTQGLHFSGECNKLVNQLLGISTILMDVVDFGDDFIRVAFQVLQACTLLSQKVNNLLSLSSKLLSLVFPQLLLFEFFGIGLLALGELFKELIVNSFDVLKSDLSVAIVCDASILDLLVDGFDSCQLFLLSCLELFIALVQVSLVSSHGVQCESKVVFSDIF